MLIFIAFLYTKSSKIILISQNFCKFWIRSVWWCFWSKNLLHNHWIEKTKSLKVHDVEFWGYQLTEMEYMFHEIFMEFISMFSIVYSYYTLFCFHKLKFSPYIYIGSRATSKELLFCAVTVTERTNLHILHFYNSIMNLEEGR